MLEFSMLGDPVASDEQLSGFSGKTDEFTRTTSSELATVTTLVGWSGLKYHEFFALIA